METKYPEEEEFLDVYSLEVQEEAKDGAVDRVSHGHAMRGPIEIRHEMEEREVCKEMTTRAGAGEHFRSSLTPH